LTSVAFSATASVAFSAAILASFATYFTPSLTSCAAF
jgi:hypothetical protein